MNEKARANLIRGLRALVATLVLCGGVASAQDSSGQGNSAPDNTKTNHVRSQTADQQKGKASDRIMTQQIRQSIMNDKNLSTYAHNIKIITQDGHVTLSGLVRSEEEKTAVAAKATDVAGGTNVTNQLEVSPAK